jgi:hypothetical protein
MAHCNTIFHQMLELLPRHHFAKLEAEHSTGRQARSFTRWSQLVHLLSMQLTARGQSARWHRQSKSRNQEPLPPRSPASASLHLERRQPAAPRLLL